MNLAISSLEIHENGHNCEYSWPYVQDLEDQMFGRSGSSGGLDVEVDPEGRVSNIHRILY